jgi:hypothetical protein
MFLGHTQRRTTVGRTPLDEGSARRKISVGERPAAAHLLKYWVRIPRGAWIFVCCECRLLSGKGLCDELITRPEESYRMCCVVVCDLETSGIGSPYIYDICHLRVKGQVINLWSCCILLVDSVESMMMHGLANPKLITVSLANTECFSNSHIWLFFHLTSHLTRLQSSFSKHFLFCYNNKLPCHETVTAVLPHSTHHSLTWQYSLNF